MATLLPGNLLALNEQDFDTDTSGWTSPTATLDTLGGGTILGSEGPIAQATATSAAPIVMATVASYPVTAGTTYLGSARSAVLGRAADVTTTIYWYDAGAVELGSVSHTETIPDGEGRRVCVLDVAPPGAVTARLEVESTVSAGGDVTYWDVMFLGPPPNAPGNLLDYDAYSVEVSEAGWAVSGPGTMQRSPSPHTGGEGLWTLDLAPAGDGTIEITRDPIPITGGSWYRWEVYAMAYSDGTDDPSNRLTLRVVGEFTDSAGDVVAITDYDAFWSPAVGGGPWFGGPIAYYELAPETATHVRLTVQIVHDASTTATRYTVDSLLLQEIPAVYTLVVHDDTANVTLTLNDTTAVAVDRATTIVRVHPDGTRYPVRGYGGDWVGTTMPPLPLVVEDYECPLDTRVWYYITQPDEIEGLGGALSTVAITGPRLEDGGNVWIKSPGLPARNTQVTMAAPPAWSRAARAGVHEIIGRDTPVVITDVRASHEGTLALHVWEAENHEALDALLNGGLPILLQAMPGHGLPGNLYLHVADAAAEPLSWNATVPGWRWTLSVRRIDRPAGGLQGSATRTWQSVLDSYETWDDVAAAYATWADVLTDTPAEGAP